MRRDAEGGRRRGKGAVAVEFALVLPILMALTLGAIDWGWWFYVDQIVTNASREGARSGSVVDPTAPSTDALSAAQTAAAGYLTRLGLTGGTTTAQMSSVNGVSAVLVTVSYPVGSLTGWWRGVLPPTVQASSVMRWQ